MLQHEATVAIVVFLLRVEITIRLSELYAPICILGHTHHLFGDAVVSVDSSFFAVFCPIELVVVSLTRPNTPEEELVPQTLRKGSEEFLVTVSDESQIATDVCVTHLFRSNPHLTSYGSRHEIGHHLML
jgi:hypothetical protein